MQAWRSELAAHDRAFRHAIPPSLTLRGRHHGFPERTWFVLCNDG